MTKQYKPG